MIGVVALIVVGPKDLPGMFRTLGKFTAKIKGMAREFSRAMDQAADDSGMKEATSSFKDMTSAKNMGLDDINDATKEFKKWDIDSETGKLAEERAANAKKIHELTAKRAEERLAAQAKRAEDAKSEEAAPKKAAKKPTAKKPSAAKKIATPKATPKKTAPKTAAKKPAAKKTAPKAAKDTA